MSNRREKSRKKGRMLAYIGAALFHVVVIAALLVNFNDNKHESVDAFDADKIDIVKGITISEDEIRKQENQLKKKDREKARKKELERKRLEELKRKAKQEKQEIAKLEEQRKKIALQKKKDEDQRKKEIAERKRKEKLEKQRREKRVAEQKRKEELERIQREEQELEAQLRLNELLAEEERLRAQQETERRARERTTTLISSYSSQIKQAINAVRTIPPGTERWRKTRVNIKLSAVGDVIDISVIESSGNAIYDRSVETAIRQASPLPIAAESEDAQAHIKLRDIILNFSVTG